MLHNFIFYDRKNNFRWLWETRLIDDSNNQFKCAGAEGCAHPSQEAKAGCWTRQRKRLIKGKFWDNFSLVNVLLYIAAQLGKLTSRKVLGHSQGSGGIHIFWWGRVDSAALRDNCVIHITTSIGMKLSAPRELPGCSHLKLRAYKAWNLYFVVFLTFERSRL